MLNIDADSAQCQCRYLTPANHSSQHTDSGTLCPRHYALTLLITKNQQQSAAAHQHSPLLLVASTWLHLALCSRAKPQATAPSCAHTARTHPRPHNVRKFEVSYCGSHEDHPSPLPTCSQQIQTPGLHRQCLGIASQPHRKASASSLTPRNHRR